MTYGRALHEVTRQVPGIISWHAPLEARLQAYHTNVRHTGTRKCVVFVAAIPYHAQTMPGTLLSASRQQ